MIFQQLRLWFDDILAAALILLGYAVIIFGVPWVTVLSLAWLTPTMPTLTAGVVGLVPMALLASLMSPYLTGLLKSDSDSRTDRRILLTWTFAFIGLLILFKCCKLLSSDALGLIAVSNGSILGLAIGGLLGCLSRWICYFWKNNAEDNK